MATSCLCQVNVDLIKNESPQVCLIDLESPHFPKGISEMMNFINSNLLLPDSVLKTDINTRIFLKIAIDTTGTLNRITVLKGINKSIDNEILRIFSIMPKWIPGEKEGKKVSGEFVLPIKFVIDNNKTNEKK